MLPQSVKIFKTKHVIMRLKERFNGKSVKEFIPDTNLKLYKDKYNEKKFYLNFEGGFVVLKRVGFKRLLAVTITKTNRNINDRESVFVKFVEVQS